MKISKLINIEHHYKIAAVGWLSRITMGFSQIVSISILLNYLGTDLYAAFAIITGLQTWFNLADYGVGSSLQNYISEYRAKNIDPTPLLCNAIIAIIIILVLSLLLFAGLSPFLQYALFHRLNPTFAKSQYYILLIVGWTYIATTMFSISYRILFANHKGNWSFFYQGIGSIFSVLAIFILKYTNISNEHKLLSSLLSWQLPNLVIALIAYFQVLPQKNIWQNFDLTLIKQILVRGLKFWGYAISATLTLFLDYLIMSQTLNTQDITIYNILFKGFNLILFIYTALLTAIWPEMAELFINKKWARANLLVKKNLSMGIIFVVFCTLVFLLAKQLIIFILAPNSNIFLPDITITLFGIYCIIRVWTDTYATALQSQNHLKTFWLYVPIQAILSISGMYLMSLKFGLNGILLGLITSFVLTASWIVPIVYYKRKNIYS